MYFINLFQFVRYYPAKNQENMGYDICCQGSFLGDSSVLYSIKYSNTECMQSYFERLQFQFWGEQNDNNKKRNITVFSVFVVD